MKITCLLVIILSIIASCNPLANDAQLTSPDRSIKLDFKIDDEGTPTYSLKVKNGDVIRNSKLGFLLEDQDDLFSGFSLVKQEMNTYDETWEPVLGQFKSIRNQYNELKVYLRQKENREMILVFRLFNDGLAFRYNIPEQAGFDSIEIASEKTEFNFVNDSKCWWIPGSFEDYEYLYNNTLLSEVDSANTPFTMKVKENLYISIHEAQLIDYTDMTLKLTENTKLESHLVPWPNGIKVKGKTPLTTPWRILQIGETAGSLIESSLILNLNDECRIADTEWIKPMKYMGIWWSVHLGFETFQIGPYHAATTEKAVEMIDYCAKFGIEGLLIEGWNMGWEIRGKRNDIPDFVGPTPDYDIKYVSEYAKKKNVKIIMYHETFGNIPHFLRNMDEAHQYCNDLGFEYVKAGSAGPTDPPGQYRHGQQMVHYFQTLIEKAAKNNIMLFIHEPIKQTGLSRTYPNWLASEGVRGMEFNAWSKGNPPSHTVTVPFTRMLAGGVDYNTGIFDIKYESLKYKDYNWRKEKMTMYPKDTPPCVKTTLAKQLAHYVIIYSPIQMLPDLPENYDGHPAFKFIQDVGLDWDDTKVLNGEIGEYVTIVRKEKGLDNWFLGSITNEEPRKFSIALDFLDTDKKYMATIYKDGDDAHWDNNPTSYAIEKVEVTHSDNIELLLAPGGGAAVSIMPVQKEMLNQ